MPVPSLFLSKSAMSEYDSEEERVPDMGSNSDADEDVEMFETPFKKRKVTVPLNTVVSSFTESCQDKK